MSSAKANGRAGEGRPEKRNQHLPSFVSVLWLLKYGTWRVQAPTGSLGGGLMAPSLPASLIAHPVVSLLALSALM